MMPPRLALAAQGYAITVALSLLSGICLASTVPLNFNDSLHPSTTTITPALSPDALPWTDGWSDEDRHRAAAEGGSPLLTSRDAKPFELRIMPLGASITYGYKSTDGNGYRKDIRDKLVSAGWKVNMVGSVKAGTMKDNNNEGHIGFTVSHVAQAAEKTIPQKPNLILLNAGTNDAIYDYEVATTDDRMDKLLNRLFDAIPGTTVILSTLLPNKRAPKRVDEISDQYRRIAAVRRKAGDRIVLAEMNNGSFLTTKDLKDTTHPTDEGYGKMASVWWTAIQDAEAHGMLQQPAKGVSSLGNNNYTVRLLFVWTAMMFVISLVGPGFQAGVAETSR